MNIAQVWTESLTWVARCITIPEQTGRLYLKILRKCNSHEAQWRSTAFPRHQKKERWGKITIQQMPRIKPSHYNEWISMDRNPTWYVHWYCRDLVWDCEWDNFVNFRQLSALDMSWFFVSGQELAYRQMSLSYLPATTIYLRLRTITWVNINELSPKLACTLLLLRSGSGLLIGKLRQFLTELIAYDTSVFFCCCFFFFFFFFCLFVCFRLITWVHLNGFFPTWYAHWYCGNLVLDCYRYIS